MNNIIKPMMISGKEVWPIVEGGKGVGASDFRSAGAFAKAGAVGTFSGTNPFLVDDNGEIHDIEYKEKTRKGRHFELVKHSIDSIISQARRASDIAAGNGRIHVNLLWEACATEKILTSILDPLKGIIHGVTAGAGMPLKLAEITSKYEVFHYPIVSSMRAFRILWKKSYSKFSKFLGGVVYECPWRAGGHLGLLPKDDKAAFLSPIPELKKIRKFMVESGLKEVPIVMAGGVWNLKEWEEHIIDEEIAPLVFQFGTRPLLTQESPLPMKWKRKLIQLNESDIVINSFSPTGFPSSAVYNDFIKNLEQRSARQIKFTKEGPTDELSYKVLIGPRKRTFFIKEEDNNRMQQWVDAGFTKPLITPDDTFIFVTPEEADSIISDQVNCMGCLAKCAFSNWRDKEPYNTGNKADPRSFCIQKSLRNIINGHDPNFEMMFSGSNGYRFSLDPMYDKFKESLQEKDAPTMKELIDSLIVGK